MISPLLRHECQHTDATFQAVEKVALQPTWKGTTRECNEFAFEKLWLHAPAFSYDDTVIRKLPRASLNGLFLGAAWVPAALSGFGRVKPVYTFFAHTCALVPGAPGDYLRSAYYLLILPEFHMSSRVSFGSFFAHPEARVGHRVYVGSYCILGKVNIGEGIQIASSVQILSGQHQHIRDSVGAVRHGGEFVTVSIGPDCWIGAGSIVMADVGTRTTIGAGSIVTRAIPADAVAVGSPARVIRSREASSADLSLDSSNN
jgi:virginiamycin A acetyltransferase